MTSHFDGWFFIGRLLYIRDPKDAAILGDDKKLFAVFGAFLPYWCRVMSVVHRDGAPLSSLPECRMCI